MEVITVSQSWSDHYHIHKRSLDNSIRLWNPDGNRRGSPQQIHWKPRPWQSKKWKKKLNKKKTHDTLGNKHFIEKIETRSQLASGND